MHGAHDSPSFDDPSFSGRWACLQPAAEIEQSFSMEEVTHVI